MGMCILVGYLTNMMWYNIFCLIKYFSPYLKSAHVNNNDNLKSSEDGGSGDLESSLTKSSPANKKTPKPKTKKPKETVNRKKSQEIKLDNNDQSINVSWILT